MKRAFLTVREVAERLRVCRATVYRMIDKGQLRAAISQLPVASLAVAA